MSKVLILGGARSGKSAYAEKTALQSGKQVIYVATATAGDEEMQQRIARHVSSRPPEWQTIEEPVELAKILQTASTRQTCILVDCMTLWMSNLLSLPQQQREQQVNELVNFISNTSNNILLVSNEVGMGIVPMGELTRQFCDETGFLHQRLAQVCDEVVLMVAGLPMFVKGNEGKD